MIGRIAGKVASSLMRGSMNGSSGGGGQGVQVFVTSDAIKDVERKLGRFAHKMPNVAASALNRSMTQVVKQIHKDVGAAYTVSKKDFKSSTSRIRAKTADLNTATTVKGRPLPIEKFKVKSSKSQGVRATVKKGSLKAVMNAFVVDLHGEKVFKREGKRRLPINRLHSISAPQMADDKTNVDMFKREAPVEFERYLNAAVDRILRQQGAK